MAVDRRDCLCYFIKNRARAHAERLTQILVMQGGTAMGFLIGIDLGTSATKTVLFDECFQEICSAAKEYPMYQPQNGWAEQDPEDWWQAACETVREVIKKSGVNNADIMAVGIAGQMHGMTMLDFSGRVLRPSIIWCDQRSGAECDEMNRLAGADRLMAVTANPAITGFTASKILWVRNHEPEIYSSCAHILLPKDYVRYRFTGDYATEVSDASGMQLLDVPNRCWSEEICEKLNIPMEWLPKVYESPEITGHITKAAADLCGLLPGTPVVGGAGDNAAAAVGTGVVREGKAFLSLGTSGVIFAHTEQPHIDPKGRVHTFCCAVPGCWHVMGVSQAAGLSLRWMRDTLCSDEIIKANGEGCDPYDVMGEEAATAPIGSNKLMYLPYLMGERTPHLDPDCRGAFIGLSAIHEKKDMIRAVMEGVAYSQRDGYEVFKEMGVSLKEFIACGGGARSPFWRQMFADVLDTPVSSAPATKGPALGAAILAAVGAGMYDSVPAACDKAGEAHHSLTPDAQRHSTYENFYQVYRGLYPALYQSFKALSKL